MRLLRSVYDETLRFHSVAIGMAFDVASSFAYRGHRIDQGDYLVLTPMSASVTPTAFADPHRFDSARCREPRNEHRQSGACQPFGLGDRTCSAMGLVELMSMTLVATLLHERAVTMTPAHHVLRRTIRPLPSPNRKFRMRLDDHGAAPVGAATPATAPSPRIAEESLVAFPGHDVPARARGPGRGRAAGVRARRGHHPAGRSGRRVLSARAGTRRRDARGRHRDHGGRDPVTGRVVRRGRAAAAGAAHCHGHGGC